MLLHGSMTPLVMVLVPTSDWAPEAMGASAAHQFLCVIMSIVKPVSAHASWGVVTWDTPGGRVKRC
jgi:hypothetical protein